MTFIEFQNNIRIDMCSEIDSFVEENNLDYGKYCKNDGLCSYDYESNQLKCECKEGFRGDRCQEKDDNCKHNKCKYGHCVAKSNGYECVCTKGWFGEHCDELKTCNIENDCVATNTEYVKYSLTDDR
jgi:hypothetical protein